MKRMTKNLTAVLLSAAACFFTSSAVPALAQPKPDYTEIVFDLYRGDSGDDVRRIQQRLTDLGYLDDFVDGKYGEKTAAAVQAFQEKNAIEGDTGYKGVATTFTQAVLFGDGVIFADEEEGRTATGKGNHALLGYSCQKAADEDDTLLFSCEIENREKQVLTAIKLVYWLENSSGEMTPLKGYECWDHYEYNLETFPDENCEISFEIALDEGELEQAADLHFLVAEFAYEDGSVYVGYDPLAALTDDVSEQAVGWEEQAGQSEETAQSEQAEEAKQAVQSEETAQSEQAETAEQAVQSEETAQSEQAEEAEQSEETAQSEQAEEAEQSEETAQSEQAEEAEQSEETAQSEQAEETEQGEQTDKTGIANPWSETEDLQDACKGSGIDFEPPVPASIPDPDKLELQPYRYMDGTLETIYTDGKDKLTVRVSLDQEGFDLAGDYTKYKKEWDENFKGLAVHCRGDGETINIATFEGSDVHYAVMYNGGKEGQGLTAEQLKSLIMGMQAMPLESGTEDE